MLSNFTSSINGFLAPSPPRSDINFLSLTVKAYGYIHRAGNLPYRAMKSLNARQDHFRREPPLRQKFVAVLLHNLSDNNTFKWSR